jgi:hypothetical protein
VLGAGGEQGVAGAGGPGRVGHQRLARRGSWGALREGMADGAAQRRRQTTLRAVVPRKHVGWP